jgi:glycolate oxidase
VAKNAAERDLLWKGRKNAFGAVGRMSPFYYVQDGVVPRTRIADTLRAIGDAGRKYGLQISNIFHAGDGNMHPIILFDARSPDSSKRRKNAATKSWSIASPPEVPSPGNTAWAWKRWS